MGEAKHVTLELAEAFAASLMIGRTEVEKHFAWRGRGWQVEPYRSPSSPAILR
jgi:hypothetical protein